MKNALGNCERRQKKKALLIRHQPFDPDLPMMCTSSLGIWEVEEERSGIPANRGYMVSPSSPWVTLETPLPPLFSQYNLFWGLFPNRLNTYYMLGNSLRGRYYYYVHLGVATLRV